MQFRFSVLKNENVKKVLYDGGCSFDYFNSMSEMPTPSDALVAALNTCRKRKGVDGGISFEPLARNSNEDIIREGFLAMNMRPSGRFYTLSPRMVEHFKCYGLRTEDSVDLRAARER